MSSTSSYHVMQFVYEKDDLSLGLLDFLQCSLQTFLKLATEARTSHHTAQIQGHQTLSYQRLRDIAGDDLLCQAFHDSRFPHARFADQHRVVLLAPGEYSKYPKYFLIAPDNGVELAFPGQLGQVTTVLLQSAIAALCLATRHLLSTAYVR